VIVHVIHWGSRQNDVRSGSSQEFRDSSAAVVVKDDRKIAKFEASVFRLQNRGRLSSLFSADGCDFVARVFGTPTVPGSHRGDRDPTAQLFQLEQRSRTLKLNVVRMSVDGEDVQLFRIDLHELSLHFWSTFLPCLNVRDLAGRVIKISSGG
jgi:hypothetical protein